MPRVTRAALRSQPSPDDSVVAAAIPLPGTPPVIRRTPLGEISGNQEELPAVVDDPETLLQTNKGFRKGKNGKATKKSKKNGQGKNKKSSEDVLPDDNESETSSAVEDACQDLRKEQTQGLNQIVTHDQKPFSPPSPAVLLATEELSQEPVLDSHNSIMANHAHEGDLSQRMGEGQEPVVLEEQKPDPSRDHHQAQNEMYDANDSVGAQENQDLLQKEDGLTIRVSMRPEDSIEAMDRFEDEMEKVGDLIPATHGSARNPKEPKEPKESKRREKSATGRPNTGKKTSSHSKIHKDSASPTLGAEANSKAAALLKRGATVLPSALNKPETTKLNTKTRQVSDSSSASEKAPNTVKKRISSVHKAPFIPAKSTKPPTRSNFELPGEAVARKLKEAREERMKREEAEERVKKPAFKARPVRLSQAPVVRPTATSKARISIAKGEVPATSIVKTTAPRSTVTPRPSGAASSPPGQRLSTVSDNKRAAPASANTSARVTGRSSNAFNSSKISTAKPIAPSSIRQSVGGADAAQLRAKGKEVFNRGRVEQDERDRMRKEKEDAAKKARAEAAERGRVASREWAEKQKAKKMAEKKATPEMATGGETSASTA